MKVEFLVDTEPYLKGDVIEIADDRAQDLLNQNLVTAVGEDVKVKIQASEPKDPCEDKIVETKAITPEDIENK